MSALTAFWLGLFALLIVERICDAIKDGRR